jgi:hypothetical protein
MRSSVLFTLLSSGLHQEFERQPTLGNGRGTV